jgi:hypothetical protein
VLTSKKETARLETDGQASKKRVTTGGERCAGRTQGAKKIAWQNLILAAGVFFTENGKPLAKKMKMRRQ